MSPSETVTVPRALIERVIFVIEGALEDGPREPTAERLRATIKRLRAAIKEGA